MKNLTPWLLVLLLVPFSSSAAVFTVTNTNDSGAGSLRQAVTDANSTSGFDVIYFELGSVTEATITLQSGLPEITEALNLRGTSGLPVLTINANGTASVFVINSPGNNQTVTISRVVIKGGNSGGLEGGGIYVGPGDTLDLFNVSVESNSAGSGPGGGIFSEGTTLLTNVTMTGNSAGTDGGGIYIAQGNMTVTNSTINGNTADRDGGGVFYGDGVITLNHVTMTNNTASNNYPADNVGDGGGIWGASQGSKVNVYNTIVAGNLDKDNGDAGGMTYAPDCARIISTAYSLIGISNDACSPSFPDINQIGSVASPIDPKLSPLANNGAFANTQALQSGSPAIDAGNPATQGNSVCASTDQRGFARPKDGDANGNARCDIGAFEVGCGDSIVQSSAGEECDDGNMTDTDSCTNSCKNARCGDTIIGPGEACDDGNTTNTDSCTNSCQNARCGDEIVGPGEGCDDANTVATDSCTNSCQLAKCSDGIIGPNEECDDSNTTNGDGCDSSCKKEVAAAPSGSPAPVAPSDAPAADPGAPAESPAKSAGGCTLLP